MHLGRLEVYPAASIANKSNAIEVRFFSSCLNDLIAIFLFTSSILFLEIGSFTWGNFKFSLLHLHDLESLLFTHLFIVSFSK